MRVFCTYGEINNYVRVCALKWATLSPALRVGLNENFTKLSCDREKQVDWMQKQNTTLQKKTQENDHDLYNKNQF